MSTRPVIFISSVSKELHTARDLVAKTLYSLGYEPKWEDIAATDAGDLLTVLRKWIDQSEAVIQLVGHCYGLPLADPDPQFGSCSYTQYEAHYAHQKGKKVYYILLDPAHPTDGCACQTQTLHDLQEQYRQTFIGNPDLYHHSDSLTETELLVRRMKDELAELRKEEQAQQDRLLQVSAATHQTVTEIKASFDELKQQAQSLPKLVFSLHSWPQASPFHNRTFPDQKNFVGRAKLLRAMKKTLDTGKDVALTQPVAMNGAGGIGKTRAAVEFVRAHGSGYVLRLFLDAQSPEALRASLADVACKLELTNDPQASAEALVLLALRLLRAMPNALVVADNADTPAALTAVRVLCHEPGGVRWLITTRLNDLGEEFAMQPVGLLEEADAVQLLQKRGRKNSHQPGTDADARAVAIELGRLPLALQQAAAYVAHQRLTWTAYSALLAKNPAQALSHDAVEMKDLPESILRTYTISFQQLTPTARLLLEIAAHLAPSPIPEAVFLHEDDDGTVRAALVELADLSLLEWQAPFMEVHRAIAIAVRHDLGLGKDHCGRLELACQALEVCSPKDMQHPDHWPAWAALRPHIEHLLAQVGPAGVSEKAYVWLLASLPNYLQALGEYASAAGYYRAAIVSMQNAVGAEHADTFACRNNLANALRAQGKYDDAEIEQRAVLRLTERVLGAEHHTTLANHNNLAVTLANQGKFAEAELEQRVVWKLRERVQGAKNPETLMSRMSLANTLQAQGKLIEAENEQRTGLGLLEQALGADHPVTLTSRMDLGNTLRAQGKHSEAEQEHRTVLQIKVRVLGAEHPDTLSSRNNLAVAINDQGKHIEAEQEHRAVLLIQVRVLGAEHPGTLSSRNNLAIALQAQGKHAEAELEYFTVLQMRERVLGAKHPDVAKACFNLASCFHDQQKLPESLNYMQRAEQGWKQVLGSDHPQTKSAKAARERIEAAM